MKINNIEPKIPMFISVLLENDAFSNDARRVWLPLPATKKQFKEAWEAAAGVDNAYVSINRYSVKIPGVSRQMLYDVSLAKVNHLASRLTGLDYGQIIKLCAISESDNMYFKTVEEVIEHTYNTDRYNLEPDILCEEDLGRREFNKLKNEHLPNYILNCIGLHDFGLSIAKTQKGEFTSLGYLTGDADRQDTVKKYSVPATLDLKGEHGEDLYREEFEFFPYEEFEEFEKFEEKLNNQSDESDEQPKSPHIV